MQATTLRQAYGISVTTSLIFTRPLALIHPLCWKPEDLGLKTWHVIQGAEFDSKAAAEKHADKVGLPRSDISSHLRWSGRAAEINGRKRASFLREGLWPGKEQVANVLVDTAFQAYPEQLGGPLGRLIGAPCNALELVEYRGSSSTKKYTGKPDTVLLDQENKQLIFLEMKVADKTTRYTLDQHIKYLTLSAFIRQKGLFPGFQITCLVLAPYPDYLKNTRDIESLVDSVETGGRIKFQYANADARAFKPVGHRTIQALVDARLDDMVGREAENVRVDNMSFYFSDWNGLINRLAPGKLKDNMEALNVYLSGKKNQS